MRKKRQRKERQRGSRGWRGRERVCVCVGGKPADVCGSEQDRQRKAERDID